jgi:hypothetical protein
MMLPVKSNTIPTMTRTTGDEPQDEIHVRAATQGSLISHSLA